MNLKCILSFHKWDGCKCRRCGATRDKDHKWDGDKCSRCGKATPEEEARFLKATEEGNYQAVETRLKTAPGLALCKDVYGNTPLHLAAERGHAPIVQMLLGYSANVNSKNQHGNTPLHLAVSGDQVSVAQLLISHRAKVDIKNQRGDTPLHVAAEKDHEHVAQLLLNHHANVNAKNQHGNTPLHLAVRHDSESVGTLFITAGTAPLMAASSEQSLPLLETQRLILVNVLGMAKASGSHRVSACLHRVKANLHRATARIITKRANMYVRLHNERVADGGAGGFFESAANDAGRMAQEETRMAHEEDSAADREIALSVQADENSKKPAQ